jgi:protein ImuB
MFASIFVPHFHVQALVRNEPELLEKAVAVVDGTPPMLKVFGMNHAARRAGVELGMPRLKVEHFFDVVLRQRSAAQEASAHAALLDCANAFSPRVEDTAADTVVIDLEGLERLFGSYHQIAAQIYDQTILVGLQPHIAVASNPDAAIHAARGFEGILVVPHGTERERFTELPLEVLSSNSDFLETLHRWGIRTFGAFAKLPRTKVAERLGQEGAYLHKLSRGELSRPLNPYKESLRFEETIELDHAILLLEPLTFVMSRLLDQICRRLRVRNRSTHEIRVTLDLDERDAPAHERVLRLPLPICDPRLLVKLLMLDLESNPPKAGVVRACVEAIPTRPRTVQNGLFVPLAPEAEKLELTLARIAHVVGQENVGYPVLVDTHRPDAFRVNRFTSPLLKQEGTLRQRRSWGGQPRTIASEPPLPTLAFRQFRPALEATVQLRAGVPSWIAFRGLFGAITTVSGPWNSSGDWWREDRWAREEWDVGIESRSNSLAMYRIYRDCASNRWFVDGVYD